MGGGLSEKEIYQTQLNACTGPVVLSAHLVIEAVVMLGTRVTEPRSSTVRVNGSWEINRVFPRNGGTEKRKKMAPFPLFPFYFFLFVVFFFFAVVCISSSFSSSSPGRRKSKRKEEKRPTQRHSTWSKSFSLGRVVYRPDWHIYIYRTDCTDAIDGVCLHAWWTGKVRVALSLSLALSVKDLLCVYVCLRWGTVASSNQRKWFP